MGAEVIRFSVIVAIGLVVSGCSPDSEQQAPTTSAQVEFPYPAVEFPTDVAVELEPPLLEAGMAATQTIAAIRNAFKPSDMPAILAQVAEGVEVKTPEPNPEVIGTTGGALYRLVDAREVADDLVEATVCVYETPGVYVLRSDVGWKDADPRFPWSLMRPRVVFTQGPAADGTTTDQLRWLLVDRDTAVFASQEEEDAVCAPFQPEPFIQKRPDPI